MDELGALLERIAGKKARLEGMRPIDRAAYLAALDRGSLADDPAPFQTLLHARLDPTLDEYLRLVEEAG